MTGKRKESVKLKIGQLKLLSLRIQKIKENEYSPRDLWNSLENTNIDIIEVLERKDRGKRAEKYLKK